MADRADLVLFGGLSVLIASRRDLVALKLHAAVDNFQPRVVDEKHRRDLRELEPTSGDLEFAFAWLEDVYVDRPNVAELAREITEEDGLG
jgi:hypothetical protein